MMIKSLSTGTIFCLFILLSFSNTNAFSYTDSVGVLQWQELMDSCNTYQQVQDFETALKWALQAEVKAKAEFGEMDTNYYNSIDNIMKIYYFLEKYDSSLFYSEKQYSLSKTLFNNDNNLEMANSLSSMSTIYIKLGLFEKALKIKEEVVSILRKANTNDNSNLASSINDLGIVYKILGKKKLAELMFIEAYEMRRRLFKTDHPDIFQSIINLSEIYWEEKEYYKTELFLHNALEMIMRINKSDYYNIGLCSGNLGFFYLLLGNLKKAEKYITEAINNYKTYFKNDHIILANRLNDLGNLYRFKNDYEKAEEFLIEALQMKKRLVKFDHETLLLSIHNLASLYLTQGLIDKALPLFIESLEIAKRIDSPKLAEEYNSLGMVYQILGQIDKAEEFLIKSIEIKTKQFSNDDQVFFPVINNLACLYFEKGLMKEAENLFIRNANNITNFINSKIDAFSEDEKVYFFSVYKELFINIYNFILKRFVDNSSIKNVFFDNILDTKALFFNSYKKIVTRVFNSNDSVLISNFNDIKSIKAKLVNLYSLPTKEVKRLGYNIDSIENIANDLEKELSLKSEDFKQSYEKKKITWKSIQTFLKPDEAAVEVVRFRYHDKRRFTDTVYYAFLIVTDQTEEHPEMIVMKDGNKLEGEYYNFYRKMLKMKIPDNESFSRYWGQLHEKLKDYKKIYFSADGIYNKINPSALKLPDGSYLIDIQDIQQVNSTKDILLSYYKGKQESSIYNSAVLIGNPNFGLEEEKAKEINKKIYADASTDKSYEQVSSLRGMELTKLPATETEINNIEKFLKSRSWVVNSFLGDNAVKAAVKSANSPRVLHIATHGLFLEDVKREAKEIFGFEEQRMVENPLLRSGLFFTGADNYLKGDTTFSVEDDNGLLTAYEAMNLDLDKTELVVLSACETGLGEVRNGEGVFGLRRAFQQAGAKSVLMSLWKVDDEATQLLMSNFYKNWVSGMTKREAFAKAQQQVRAKYPEPYYWGAFVMVGE
jgi:CHAT domain-containing protein